MISTVKHFRKTIAPEQFFMLSAFLVNGGNYAYNLILGRVLGPEAFADAAILITFLLVLSFIAMTFQLAVAKFTAEFDANQSDQFLKKAYSYATRFGFILGLTVIVSAGFLQQVFNTASSSMFVIFGCAIPLYFIMSVNRGTLQGNQSFIPLSLTYQLEMLFRLIVTFSLLLIFKIAPSYAVSIAIGLSFIAGLFPFKTFSLKQKASLPIARDHYKLVLKFFILTAFYELTQIVCNNSDILLVKHFFESYEAGLYASLALIGRVVYFVTWMFVMILLPKVIQLRKAGENSVPVLMKYVGYVCLLAFTITSVTFIAPEFAVRVLFGTAYIAVAPLLGWYALATSFFAISNIFAYYFLSLDQYKPIVLAALFGMLQVMLIVLFHENLFEVVLDQVVAMGALLIAQVGYFIYSTKYAPKSLTAS